ncbi:acetylglutamate semialdehyde dehydrogenase [Robertmurraya massiliosenegalensis]|uniref:acetylglutamate semialdehyde dehydrogenase n=1 Tax=Robertmurraya TaxID=2837507 RepID=UPI0039A74236
MISVKGIDIKEYLLAEMDDQIEKSSSLLRFSEKELVKYNELLKHFKDVNGSGATNEEKGKALEDLVNYIIDKSVIFEGYKNVRTSSNEIDILIRLSKKGNFLKAQGLIIIQDNFLAECKNYNSSVSSTWVGKFSSLMNYTQNQLGILFSYHGLSGSGWNDATGLTKKLLLSDKKTYIIDFNFNDFEQLANGKSFNELIIDKMFALKNDISFSHLITSHPNQNLIKP